MSTHPSGLWKPKPKFRISALVGVPDGVTLDGQVIEGGWKGVQFEKRFPLHFVPDFINLESSPTEVLRFTKKYGPLFQTPHGGPKWNFNVKKWQAAQMRLRDQWEISGGLIAAPVPMGAQVGHELTWIPIPRNQRQFIDASKFKLSGEDSLTFDQKQNQITFEAGNLFRYLWVSLFALPSDRLAKCKRPREEGCDSPYFVAEHLSQEYCSDGCQHWGQKAVKREWWHRQQHEKRRNQLNTRKGGKQPSGSS